MTTAQRVLGPLAEVGVEFYEAEMSHAEDLLHGLDTSLVEAVGKLIEDNVKLDGPASMLNGSIKKSVENAKPELMGMLDTNVDKALHILDVVLKGAVTRFMAQPAS